MNRIVLWVVGEPGVGKTTLIRQFLDVPKSPAAVTHAPRLVESPKWTVGRDWAAAGHYIGGAFDGADTVPYNGVKAALEYWRENLSAWVNLTVFDGDRFSCRSAIDFFVEMARWRPIKLCCVLLTAREDIVARRRASRGTTQTLTWVKGRKTKARRFFEEFSGTKKTIDANQSSLALGNLMHFYSLECRY